jgi:DNA polymerase-3 subunit delta
VCSSVVASYDGPMAEAPPVALVWGESEFLVREAALQAAGETRVREVAGADWEGSLLSDLATPSLLGEDRTLLVTDAQDLGEDALRAVAGFAAAPPAQSRLILAVSVGPRAKGPPRKLVKALGDGPQVRRAAVERRDLPAWVRERTGRHGIRATAQGAAALIETVGEDPAALDQALAQVAAAHGEAGLTPDTVRAQFRGLGDRRVWELCDAAFGGSLPAALRVLRALLDAREEPLAILGGVAARLRDLIRVASVPPRTPPAEVARAAGLRFDWQARRYAQQIRRFPPGALSSLHTDLVEADRALKQGGSGDVVLARVVTRIAAQAAGAAAR